MDDDDEGLGHCPGSGMAPANGACPICGHWPTVARAMPPHGETVDEAGNRRRWVHGAW